MNKIRIGINGFGRIGRITARIILGRKEVDLVAINSRADTSSHAYLLKYDTTYGTFGMDVSSGDGYIKTDSRKINVLNADNPSLIHWKKYAVDLVIDATGKFRTKKDLEGHLSAGAKQVVLSAPAKDGMTTLVMGVNHQEYQKGHDEIVSNSSCTTNCLSTVIKVLEDASGVESAFMTTVHAVTDSQNLLDNSHGKEIRLRRSSLSSIIPSSTGSARDIVKLFPGLSGKIACQALRVPVATVSLINLVARLKKSVSKDEINALFAKAANSSLKGILKYTDFELVSSDYKGSPYSSIVDGRLTDLLDGRMVNVYAWYDNEWGYASRLVDLCIYIGKKAGFI